MTDTLIHALARATDQPVHTVLHIGAGPAPLQAYGELATEQLVLVEGDPDTFADLAAELQLSGRTGVQGLQRVVLPQAGPVLWHRYNVRRLNAPQPMAELRAVYPRLVELSQLPQDGVALAELANDWLQPVADTDTLTSPAHALVLDVPGQEAALLAALPPALLRRFRYVAIRAAGQPTGEAWAALAGTVERLRAECFSPVHDTAADEPLWPVAVMRFDAEAFARAQLLARCQSLEEALAQANVRLSESEATASSLLLERDTQAALAMERQARIDALSQAKATAEKQAADRATQLQQMTQQRDEQAKLVAAGQQRIDALGKEVTQLTAARDNLTKERNALVVARDEQTNAAREANQNVTALNAEMAEILARHGLLQEELVKAEAQIELIADLLLREPRT
jgi:chemotaxis protein histidine kinase CheA